MSRYTLEQWKAEAKRRFGDHPRTWAFLCPQCGHVATCEDWKSRGARPEDAPRKCIELESTGKLGNDDQPCDWAAFGLLKTLGKGVEIEMPDGKVVEAFDFAPVAVAA